MNKTYKLLACGIIALWAAACSEDDVSSLPKASVGIQNYTVSDTIEKSMAILKDSIITINIAAEINSQPAKKDHHVRFGVDESKLALYHKKYGDAFLLPYTSYLFLNSSAFIRKGETLSEAIEINIIRETLLRPYSTYVLPLVIETVDGEIEAVATNETMYLVLKAGKASVISKAEWSVVDASSNPHRPPFYAIDDNVTTSWSSQSSVGPVPTPYIVISFGYELTFSGVSYLPVSTTGAPTKLQLEFSVDGTNWVDKGVFDVVSDGTLQEVHLGITSAQYMRFTALEYTKYFGILNNIAIREISLIP